VFLFRDHHIAPAPPPPPPPHGFRFVANSPAFCIFFPCCSISDVFLLIKIPLPFLLLFFLLETPGEPFFSAFFCPYYTIPGPVFPRPPICPHPSSQFRFPFSPPRSRRFLNFSSGKSSQGPVPLLHFPALTENFPDVLSGGNIQFGMRSFFCIRFFFVPFKSSSQRVLFFQSCFSLMKAPSGFLTSHFP